MKVAGDALQHNSTLVRQNCTGGGCGRGFPPPAGGSGWAAPGKFLKFASPEMHFGAFSEPKSVF